MPSLLPRCLAYWPSRYYFYPFGNTSAISLTADLPVNEPAEMLLLGCGDPRNVLYTILTEPAGSTRLLDFTCCDFDPAILARNILLFTMIVDKQPVDVLWNTFFHFRLDKTSLSTMIAQCHKLIDLSETIDGWKESPYGSSLRMSTDYTLSEVRRHWKLYIDMENIPQARKVAIFDAFQKLYSDKKLYSDTLQRGLVLTPALRSAGPLVVHTSPTSSLIEGYANYWKTGTTFFAPDSRVTKATEMNPTFVYSLGGEGASLHYGSDPLTPFHLAPIFANAAGNVAITEVVDAVKEQFKTWCSAYESAFRSRSPPIVRFIVGDSIAVSRALLAYNRTGTLKANIPVSQWTTNLIQLSPGEYTTTTNDAPSLFNVIHTSNLVDDLGLFNVIVSSIPILSSSPFSILYSESLLHLGKNATKEFAENMKADITVMGVLLNLVPTDYISGYSSRSNTHELIMHRALHRRGGRTIEQFHQVTTWKRPTTGDRLCATVPDAVLRPSFDALQLGTLLYDIYEGLYNQETITNFMEMNKKHLGRAISGSNLAHHTREAFVVFLKLVKDRLHPSEEYWKDVIGRFMSLKANAPVNVEPLYFPELCCQLLRHNVYRAPPFQLPPKKIGRFSKWASIPDIVRVVLVVPRVALAVFENSKFEEIGTPLLQCDIFSSKSQRVFNSIHASFGRIVSVGTEASPRVIFEEDLAGRKGQSPVIVSFLAPAGILSELQNPPETISIGFGVRNTPAACMTLIPKLGYELRIFSASLMDESQVCILPDQPLPAQLMSPPKPVKTTNSAHSATVLSQIGTVSDSTSAIQLDEECELVSSFTAHISITDPESLRTFCAEGSQVVPQVSQVLPCVIRVTLGKRVQDILYPFPIYGQAHRLRLARKSKYIEVIVPPSRSLLPGGMQLNPYSVISVSENVHPWGIHRVNLPKLTTLNLAMLNGAGWYNTHLGSMFSTRESDFKRKQKHDVLTFVKDSINSIFIYAAGAQGGAGPVKRLFCLRDKKTRDTDTIFFIHEIRFDAGFHTLVLDGYVLCLTTTLIRSLGLGQPFTKLMTEGNMSHITVFGGEMLAWKQLLPALVERCRSWSHRSDCVYKSQDRIPLSQAEDVDPLCRCGQGKDVDGMRKNPLWKPFAPHVTRFALSPLFGISYLETVGRSPDAHKCSICRGKGNPKIKICTGCQRVKYCSAECQKKDWELHKPTCKGK